MNVQQRERVQRLLEGYPPDVREGVKLSLESLSDMKLGEALDLMEASWNSPHMDHEPPVKRWRQRCTWVLPSRWWFERVLLTLEMFFPQEVILTSRGAVPLAVFREDEDLWTHDFEVHHHTEDLIALWEGSEDRFILSISLTEGGLQLEAADRETLRALVEILEESDDGDF